MGKRAATRIFTSSYATSGKSDGTCIPPKVLLATVAIPALICSLETDRARIGRPKAIVEPPGEWRNHLDFQRRVSESLSARIRRRSPDTARREAEEELLLRRKRFLVALHEDRDAEQRWPPRIGDDHYDSKSTARVGALRTADDDAQTRAANGGIRWRSRKPAPHADWSASPTGRAQSLRALDRDR